MIRGEFQIIDGKICDSSAEAILIQDSRIVYEVVRVIKGIPLYFELHFERLLQSCRTIGVAITETEEEIVGQIQALSLQNRIVDGNIIWQYFFSPSRNYSFNIHFIQHRYPNSLDYALGVTVGLLFAERVNPEAKVVQASLRNLADEAIAAENLYEVLLVDSENCITEGSRSNVFFVKGETIYSSPLTKVLKGITLMKVFDICLSNSIEIIQTSITVTELSSFDAAFLTGTSPKILPIKQIGEVVFHPTNETVKKLISIYNEMISRYIEERNGYIV